MLKKDADTLHLMTQRDQPYGSVRRCCERCGLMICTTDRLWTDDPEEYDAAPNACSNRQRE